MKIELRKSESQREDIVNENIVFEAFSTFSYPSQCQKVSYQCEIGSNKPTRKDNKKVQSHT
jgi:hypothetical protein